MLSSIIDYTSNGNWTVFLFSLLHTPNGSHNFSLSTAKLRFHFPAAPNYLRRTCCIGNRNGKFNYFLFHLFTNQLRCSARCSEFSFRINLVHLHIHTKLDFQSTFNRPTTPQASCLSTPLLSVVAKKMCQRENPLSRTEHMRVRKTSGFSPKLNWQQNVFIFSMTHKVQILLLMSLLLRAIAT